MFLNGTIGLTISLNIVGVVAMVLNNLVRAKELVREFANSVVVSRTLDLNMNLDDVSDFEIWLSFGTIDTVTHGFASFFNEDLSYFCCKFGVIRHIAEIFKKF